MPSTPSKAAYAVSALTLFSAVTDAHSHERSILQRRQDTVKARRGVPAMTYEGCYSSSAGFTDQGSYTYQSYSYCQPICFNQNQAVFATSGGSDCWCGDTLPPASSKVDDSKCNTPCQGYGTQNCGGTNFWSVFLSGSESSAPNYSGSASASSGSPTSTSSASSATTAPPSSSTSTEASTTTTAASSASVVTSVAPGHTVVITAPAQQQASATDSAEPTEHHKSSTNVAGIAAGVVIGVVAVAAIIGGLVFWLRRRKQQSAEDEYKRSTQVKDFMHGGKEQRPPPSAWSNLSDSRLDPTAQRRNSAGSIADAGDYSRKILRVANPDGT